MCGIAGFKTSSNVNYVEVLNGMTNAMKTRGPDDSGLWFDENSKTGLCHARLSILDLTSTGHQPMTSKSGRLIMVFNGEIYNYKQLKAELGGVEISWRGTSDSEVLLEAIERWGMVEALQKATGMFALAVMDRKLNKIYLARDRFGEKPLYYGLMQGSFIFASDLKALKIYPGVDFSIDRVSLARYLQYGNVPAPYSIYKNVFKVEPGSVLCVDAVSLAVDTQHYWSTQDCFSSSTPRNTSADQYVDKLESVLSESVGSQMISDVSLGAFLSGGIDSTTVVALMQKHSTTKVKTFSIGFDDPQYNEAEHARLVAKHLGTDHHDLYVSGRMALDVVPLLPAIYDEPFSDASQIPTYLVSSLAKKHVTVALTGDGGDELFGGYKRYLLAKDMWAKISRLPLPVRETISRALKSLPFSVLDKTITPLGRTFKQPLLADKLLKLGTVLGASNRQDFYRDAFLSYNSTPANWVIGCDASADFSLESGFSGSFLTEMMLLDLMIYLPNDNLVKVDRASMAVSLETRAPFLDKSVVQYAAQIPEEIKVRSGVGKWPLRQVLYRYVPQELIEKPKVGFAVPLASWLRGPLRDWAENYINENRLLDEGYFNAKIVQERWREHLSGRRNWQYQLWSVLMFQCWLESVG
ncbi:MULTISPECIES: asparagine synthase (glutamine-hydrolyzing) [Stutzerimonas stutzeri subgroup]|uniref:asparagine synthase (glutamine-hydrolyzing) n=2 Tax=Stutzerimonas stutzeri subgroup TaxID=578833 RepID=A0A5S5BES4_STUST|nr:asparagine synthase (glutamine-hydrolyzing) [Stutzerimonas stutzeri]TYP65459.1 asparagine synthase (glutamine-hydrolysing) [Stutzerimonas stutzeri]